MAPWVREVPGKRSPRERTLLHPDARRTSWSHQGARTGKAGLVPVAAGQGPQPYVRTTLAFLKRPQLVPWGPLGQGEAPSPAGSHSSGLAGDGSLKSKEFKGTGKRQRLQGSVSACRDASRVRCGPFWKFSPFCLLPRHFLEAKINTDIPARVNVTGVYPVSVKSYAPKPSSTTKQNLPVSEWMCPIFQAKRFKAIFVM